MDSQDRPVVFSWESTSLLRPLGSIIEPALADGFFFFFFFFFTGGTGDRD